MKSDFSAFVIPFCAGVLLLFIFSVWKYIRWIRHFDKLHRALIRRNIFSWRIFPVIWESFREGLLHWRITKRHPLLGYMHRSLAFGWFLLIVVGAVQAGLARPDGHPFWFAIFYNFFVHTEDFPAAPVFANLMDALLVYVLSGVLLALVKKIYSRAMGMKRTARHTLLDRATKLSLWLIFPMRLLSESVTAGMYANGGFLTNALGRVTASAGLADPAFEYVCWLIYSLSLGVFFSLMPFTRYMHIFTEVFLIFFRRMGLSENPHGKTGYTMFELSSCSRCGLCIDACPVSSELGIQGTQAVYMLQSVRNLEKQKYAADIARNCLMCDACVAACPVGIENTLIRRQVRICDKSSFDRGDYSYLSSVHGFNAVGRVGYFSGCMGRLTPGISVAMKKIFDAAGQRFWHIDAEKNICCGRPLLQQGFDNQAAALRQKNTELLVKSGIRMLITSCPICYRSFKEEYRLDIPVLHHSEYIDFLLRNGLISLRNSGKKVTYHDPCELGRGCGVYDPPRRVLEASAVLLPTASERESSKCCGYNLGNTALSVEQQKIIRDASRDNLLKPHPDLVATACPMCKKAFSRADSTPVLDIAEIVVEQLI